MKIATRVYGLRSKNPGLYKIERYTRITRNKASIKILKKLIAAIVARIRKKRAQKNLIFKQSARKEDGKRDRNVVAFVQSTANFAAGQTARQVLHANNYTDYCFFFIAR